MRSFIIMLVMLASLSQLHAQLKCNAAMEDSRFRKALLGFSVLGQGAAFNQAVRSFTSASCLNTNQLQRLAALYRDPAMRLDYACFAQSYAIDRQNYSSLENLFPDQMMRDQFLSCIGMGNGGGGNNGGGRIGCPNPVNAAKFSEIKSLLASHPNSFTRMDVAKQVIPRNCFNTSQVREMAALWNNEFDRRDFLYFTYDFTYDLDNYYKMEDMFVNTFTRRDFVAWCMAK